MPALASAATYVVDETENVAPDVGCTAPGGGDECDLWEAIELSNSTPGVVDTIEFSVNRVAVEVSPLPAITQPVNIDGTAEDGHPGVELDGETEGYWTYGLQVTGSGVTIRGLAIHHVEHAIGLQGSDARVCNSYLGTDLTGDFSEDVEVGVDVDVTGVDNEIGAGCPSGEGNVISGNEWFGIRDSGTGTRIARNLIGMDAFGEPLPNGEDPPPSVPAGGIFAEGDDTLVGGPGEGNVIAFNQGVAGFFEALGGGVVVSSESVAIRGNSIFDNVDQGIFFWTGISGSVPAVNSAASSEATGTTVVGGIIEGEPGEDFTIDVFANLACDVFQSGFEEFSEAGEGETYLGSATVKTGPGGTGEWKTTVPVQDEGTVLTATATAEGMAASTSEFSACLVAPKPTPKPPPPDQPGPPPPATNQLIPENGETLAVEPLSGVIYVKLPGKGKQVKLTEGMLIPVGAVVDATKGKVTLTSVNKAGETQTAVFFGGKFLVAQRDGSGLVTLKLRGNLECGKAGPSSATASAGRKGRKLWGSGKGKFRTEGNYGSATVRGTVWLTEDRCSGTFFKVRKGVVTVRDFSANETFPLGKGKSYLASP